ncbi:MAG: hypothetical protein Pg6A_01010 [Termitinemataceae bacterium]|nr:MAG: hypothetical protein Pg6A_01010 [Termitinemataceae bacterium]
MEARREKEKIKSRSVAKAISALRSFFRFIIESGLRLDNPAALMEPPTQKTTIPSHLERSEVEELLAKIDVSSQYGLRDRAIFELIYSSGLRISEASALDLQDIFFNESVIRVCGKGSKERFVPFGSVAESALKAYLSSARNLLLGNKKKQCSFCFKNRQKNRTKGDLEEL